jgi:Fur family ferric uptake transcriptional regulator
MAHEAEHRVLAKYLEEHHLKRTRQRETILDAFLQAGGHVSAEDLHQRIRARHPHIGYTTVYRTLKLLVDVGLAEERHFDDGIARYETERTHHDHLVCTSCGKIIEFESESIEKAQRQVASDFQFELLHHRHELYGRCADCRSGRRKPEA